MRRVLVAAVAVVSSVLTLAVPAAMPKAAAAPSALVVLDPDDNYSYATWNGQHYTELPITSAIAVQAKAKLEALCDTSVEITRDASQNDVPRAQRAAMMQHADVSMTLSLNNETGAPWGTAADGGSIAFATNYANNLAFAQRTLDTVTQFTGRPNAGSPNQGGTNGTTYPYPEFANLPGTYEQAFLLYMDHNFDWPAIQGTNGQYDLLVNAVVTAVGKQLQAQGITCGSNFPAPPSAAELAALFALGFANYMRYGADPVNFATGNFLQSADLFSLSGPGGSSTGVSLTYNSQDPRTSRFGNGWSSGLDARSQTYKDNSVLITSPDGSATAFTKNSDGSYTGRTGVYATLTRTASHTMVLSMPDTSTETFAEDANTGAGVMTAQTDRQGHVWTYGYGTASGTAALTPLASVRDAAGQSITFGADPAGRVTSVTRPDGAVWKLGYDGHGNLVTITDANGHSTSYGYDAANRMTTVTDAAGITFITNTYDPSGRVIAQRNGDGKTNTISYGDGSTTYTDTTGATTTFSIDGQGRVTKVVTPLGHAISTDYHNYDTSSKTDADGHATSYSYDSSGNMVAQTDPTGAQTRYAYTASSDLASSTAPDGRVTTYTVDARGNTTAIAGPDGAHWQQTFDAAGELTSRTDPNGHTTHDAYDARGNLTAVTDAAGAVTTLSYDSADRVTATSDPDGHTSSYTYDAVGNLVKLTDPMGGSTAYAYDADDLTTSVTDPNGHATKYSYNNGLNLATVTDPAGAVTTFGYDSEYRRTSVSDPDGHVTKYAYNAEGLLTSSTDPAGKVTRRGYDAAQNLTSVTDPAGAQTSIAYDADSRPTIVTDSRGGKTVFGYDITGRITSVTDPDGRKTSYSYDPGDRVVSVTDPTGAISKQGYDPAGNRTTSTDATGRTTTLAYDALNRVITSTNPAGAKTAYNYDPAGQLVKTTDPAGRTTAYTYDADGHTTSSIDAAGDSSKWAYDPAGNVTGITDPRGGRITFGYDPDNRLTGKTDQNGNSSSFGYDAAGQQTSTTDPSGVVTDYSHDPRGLLTQVIENAAGTGATAKLTSSYAYDDAGRLSQTTDPAGHSRGYTYDTTGNVTTASDPLGAKTSYSYDPAAQITSRLDANGKSTSYGYDGDGQISTVTPPAGQHGIAYSYDQAGRMTGMTDGTGSSVWSYDQAGQVASAKDSNGKVLSYGYDPSGLRMSLSYPDATKATYGRDAAGRITTLTTSAGAVTYSYDPSGEITGIRRPNGTATSYSYDPAGQVTDINHTAPAAATGSSLDASPLSPEPGSPVPSVPTASGGTQPAAGSSAGSAAGSGVVTNPAAGVVPTAPSALGQTGAASGTQCVLLSILLGCTATTKTAVAPLPLKLDYSYDANGHVASAKQTSGSGSKTTALSTDYSYDPLGRLTGSTRSDGQNASYSYDSAGDRTGVSSTDPVTGALIATTATYNAADQLTEQVSMSTLGSHTSSATTTDTYDANGNLSSAATSHTASDSNLLNQLLGSLLGSLLGFGTSGTQTSHYSYDYDNRLSSVTAPDPTSSLADPAADQTLTSTFGYDGLGRAVNQTIAEPHHADRLLQISASLSVGGLVSASLGVDINGKPCATNTSTCRATLTPFGGDATDVTYDGSTPVSWSDAGRTLNVINGPEGADQQTDTRYGSEFFHLDDQGSPRVLTGATGQTVAAGAYDDWGNPQPAPGTHQVGGLLTGVVSAAGTLLGGLLGLAPQAPYASVASATPVGYTGQLSDPAQGLTHFRARSYNPAQATWLQCDPHSGSLTDPARLNHYDYVDDAPTSLVDPSGADPVPVCPPSVDATGCHDYSYTGICDYGSSYCASKGYTGLASASSDQDCRQNPFLTNCSNPKNPIDPRDGAAYVDPATTACIPETSMPNGTCTRYGQLPPSESPAQRQARYEQHRKQVLGQIQSGIKDCVSDPLVSYTEPGLNDTELASCVQRITSDAVHPLGLNWQDVVGILLLIPGFGELALTADELEVAATARLAEAADGEAGAVPPTLKGAIPDAIPHTLLEQLALNAAKNGQGTEIMGNLADAPRLSAVYGQGTWVKMQYVLRGTDSKVVVHYFRNLDSKIDVEFKFK